MVRGNNKKLEKDSDRRGAVKLHIRGYGRREVPRCEGGGRVTPEAVGEKCDNLKLSSTLVVISTLEDQQQ